MVAGTSASAVLVFSAVTALGPKDPGSYATLAAGMIVVTGLIFVAAGLLKLGLITAFLSRPVMEGFVFGLAIFVTVSQLPKRRRGLGPVGSRHPGHRAGPSGRPGLAIEPEET